MCQQPNIRKSSIRPDRFVTDTIYVHFPTMELAVCKANDRIPRVQCLGVSLSTQPSLLGTLRNGRLVPLSWAVDSP